MRSDNHTRLRTFIPDTCKHPPGTTLPKKAWVRFNFPSHRCRAFPLLFVQMEYGLFCGLWVWRRGTNRRPCCPPMPNPSTSFWTAWIDWSGRWDNRMSAQHLPRNLAWSSSGLKNWIKRRHTVAATGVRRQQCGWDESKVGTSPGSSDKLWPPQSWPVSSLAKADFIYLMWITLKIVKDSTFLTGGKLGYNLINVGHASYQKISTDIVWLYQYFSCCH